MRRALSALALVALGAAGALLYERGRSPASYATPPTDPGPPSPSVQLRFEPAPAGGAAKLTGRVRWKRATPPARASGAPRVGEGGALGELLVTLSGGPARPARPAPSVRLTLEDGAFEPRAVAMPVGASLSLLNRGPGPASVALQQGGARLLGFGLPEPGLEAALRLDAPGLLTARAGEVEARVHVYAAPEGALTTEDGRFDFEGLAPGHYVLTARLPGAPQRVELDLPGPGTLDLQLVLL